MPITAADEASHQTAVLLGFFLATFFLGLPFAATCLPAFCQLFRTYTPLDTFLNRLSAPSAWLTMFPNCADLLL